LRRSSTCSFSPGCDFHRSSAFRKNPSITRLSCRRVTDERRRSSARRSPISNPSLSAV
jgi:hypothetical protein